MTPERLQTVARRIADQLDSASIVLRQDPVTEGDLLRVRTLLEAEAALLKLLTERLGQAKNAQRFSRV